MKTNLVPYWYCEATTHWEKVGSWLDALGNGNVDPITADRKIRELTGGKSVPEVMEQLSGLMASVGQHIGK